MYGLPGRRVLGRGRGDRRERVRELCSGQELAREWCQQRQRVRRLPRRHVRGRGGERVCGLCGRQGVERDGRERRGRVCRHRVCGRALSVWERLSQLHRRHGLERDGGEQRERVRDVPEQHVFAGGGGKLHVMSSERAVGGGERGPGVLLLQTGIRACGGRAHVPDLRSGDVEQPARAHGVLELLAWLVLSDFRGCRERDVSAVCGGSMVAGGQRELQSVPGELARAGVEWVHQQLRLQRRILRPERKHVLNVQVKFHSLT